MHAINAMFTHCRGRISLSREGAFSALNLLSRDPSNGNFLTDTFLQDYNHITGTFQREPYNGNLLMGTF